MTPPEVPAKPPGKRPVWGAKRIWSVTQVSSLQELSQLVGFEMEELGSALCGNRDANIGPILEAWLR